VLPSYFTDKAGKNAKDWYRGWDAANAAAPVEETKPTDPDAAAKAKAKADLDAALGDLGDIFGKGTRLNIMPEQEQKLLPVLTRVMDAAFRMGYYKFKDAARFVVNTIREKLGADVSDQITLDHLQGAYIGMAGKYQDQGASSKKEVIAVESLAELEETKPKGPVEIQVGKKKLKFENPDATLKAMNEKIERHRALLNCLKGSSR
jgi:hypothetical protein